MNIAMAVNTNINATTQPNSKMQTSMDSSQKFGSVFGQILSNSQIQPVATPQANSEEDVLQDLLAILNVTSLEELESLVGLEELTVSTKELKGLLEKLLAGETNQSLVNPNPSEELIESNVWDVLAGINEQATKIVEAIISSLNGQGPSNPTDAKQAIELLKTVQLIGNKSDLTIKEESTLFDIKQLLENVKETLGKNYTNETTSKPQVLNQSIVQTKVLVKQVSQLIKPEVVVTETKETTTNVQASTTTVIQTKVESVSMTLPTEKAAQSEEFIKELQKVMNRVQFGQAGGANRLVLKLFPEQLGTIRIELIQKDGMLTAKLLASTALGKEMLDSNSSQLRQGFAGQNIQLEKLEITQALQESTRQEKNQDFQQSFKQQQEEQDQQENSNDQLEEQFSFEDYLQEMEV
ncbi:flagellar hook-length control protein FliK [Psychrobacillus psychrodurans]|uniref:Flagellar hook-length control protein FliK n=1 Tax=Psychrobacillus psychrodurans TaxID=126157 RepID=A0A9X3L7K6_9BACI|nr:flagellar hook-length control protein FliK [Psychrobacillus psychrodurans]MCZ8532781.1 flagellar hook-length control protein FliK [Psychrobacillus psychrodurans]